VFALSATAIVNDLQSPLKDIEHKSYSLGLLV